ncbi:MAG: HEAT repeat domain-containing protein [Myxococcota bacterium]
MKTATTPTRRALGLTLLVALCIPGPAAAQQERGGPSAIPTPALKTPGDLPAALKPSPAPTKSLSASERTERLKFLLSGYEYFPERAELERLGDDATMTSLLVTLARDEAARPMLRTRAVDALGYYDHDTSTAYLSALTRTSTARLPVKKRRVASSMRHHAIMALGQAMGARALDALAPLLGDDDLQIQMTAAASIGRYTGKAGTPLLTKALEEATHPALRRELQKHLHP